jgi:hypothetical protein
VGPGPGRGMAGAWQVIPHGRVIGTGPKHTGRGDHAGAAVGVLAELVNAFNCRSDYLSLFKVGVFQNGFLILSVIASLGMMVAVIEWDPLAYLFHTTPLAWQDWLLAAGLSLTLIPVVELTKWIISRQRRRPQPAAAA